MNFFHFPEIILKEVLFNYALSHDTDEVCSYCLLSPAWVNHPTKSPTQTFAKGQDSPIKVSKSGPGACPITTESWGQESCTWTEKAQLRARGGGLR